MSAEMFSEEQLAQIKLAVRDAVREEFDRAGLRVDAVEDIDHAREDFRFLRRVRRYSDNVARGLGMWIIAGGLGILGWIITTAAGVWKSTPPS